MPSRKFCRLRALLQALVFGALAFPAAAQTVVIPASAPYMSDERPSVLGVQSDGSPVIVYYPSPAMVNSQPDPSADSKCRFVVPSEYWGCVNGHNGGGG